MSNALRQIQSMWTQQPTSLFLPIRSKFRVMMTMYKKSSSTKIYIYVEKVNLRLSLICIPVPQIQRRQVRLQWQITWKFIWSRVAARAIAIVYWLVVRTDDICSHWTTGKGEHFFLHFRTIHRNILQCLIVISKSNLHIDQPKLKAERKIQWDSEIQLG